jgi:hypothetical protein
MFCALKVILYGNLLRELSLRLLQLDRLFVFFLFTSNYCLLSPLGHVDILNGRLSTDRA